MKIFNRPGVNWIVDTVLFAGFLVCFFLDLTGVLAHQWLGLAGAALAGYHLVAHWKWVKTVTARLLSKTSAQARLYYGLDVGILAGTAAITVTGLAISTWLALPLDDYPAWRDVHVAASVITLALIVIKIGVHWRWIINTARRYIFNAAPAAAPAAPRAAKPAAARLGRREFLGMMGGVSLAAVVATSSVLRSDGSGEVAAETDNASALPAQQPAAAVAAPAAIEQVSSTIAAADTTAGNLPGNLPGASNQAAQAPAATATTPSITATPTEVPTATAEPIVVACTVRCPKGCSYPGRCRRYTDANGNNKCDLGECL